ncbi:hydantoinase/carbamoylase family amidase [Endozoicomonas lisbonensis]|uniref:N-carbamoyl-L-amino-acid hydrolase n=1 Tax=Endozoicomonas lisbonensis TaxID=3120522 RepID=A0ABV2SDC0_9GAMM
MTKPQIKPERLLADLQQLRRFGEYKSGVVRPALSPVDMEARRWLRERMLAASLDAHIDGVGNVIGYSGKQGPTLLMGSHTDTQPEGGWLDGAYGVICALEVCRALQECPETTQMSVDIASWSDEEHTFHGFLGSKSFLGLLEPDVIRTATNADGHSLEQALFDAGLNGVPHRYQPDRYIAYLEPHIEQGPRLELSNKRLGIVTGIVGCRDYDITFTGEANHAGSTPMELRKDAGMAMVDFIGQLNRRFQQLAGQFTVWTVGRIDYFPGAACVIPGQAIMRLQFRDTSQGQMNVLEQALRQLVDTFSSHSGFPVTVSRESITDAVTLDRQVQSCLQEAAEEHYPEQWQSLPSAAMHDANMFAPVMPTGMLFVPSIKGISHNLAEDTRESDLITGCQLAAYAAARIINEAT